MTHDLVFRTAFPIVAAYMIVWVAIAWRAGTIRGSLSGDWAKLDIFSANPTKTFHAIRTLYSPLPSDRLLAGLAWTNRILFIAAGVGVVLSFASFPR